MHDEKQLRKDFDRLVGRHKRLIKFLCQRASYGQEAYCSDLMQECYLTLLNRMVDKEMGWSEQRERVWVYWQCRSAIDCYRRKQSFIAWLPLSNEMADTQPAPREVTRLTIDELAANLNGTERRCFLLMAEGADDKELERELGLKHRSVVQMRHNIKKKLQKYSER